MSKTFSALLLSSLIAAACASAASAPPAASTRLTAKPAPKTTPESFEGSPAPELALDTLDGKPFRSRIFRGGVLVLTLWSTSRPACSGVLSHTSMLAADTDRAQKGLFLYAVNNGEEKETVTKFADKSGLKETILVDPKMTMAKAFLIKDTPVAILIGRDSTVRKVFVGYGGKAQDALMDKKIDELLKEPKPSTHPATQPAQPSKPSKTGGPAVKPKR